MNQLLWALLSVALAGVPAVAQAQAYPTKPIRLIVTFAAGGGTDLAARAVAPKLAEALGQPVVVENRAGANGAVGAEATAKSPADGYTLMVGAAGTLAVAPHLNAKLPFDPFKDFAPVSLLATSAFVVSVNPSVKAQSIRELVALAKASPGSLTFGSSGTGGAHSSRASSSRARQALTCCMCLTRGSARRSPTFWAGRSRSYSLTWAW